MKSSSSSVKRQRQLGSFSESSVDIASRVGLKQLPDRVLATEGFFTLSLHSIEQERDGSVFADVLSPV